MANDNVELLLNQVKALNRRLRREQPAVDGLSTAALVVLTQAARHSEPHRPGQLAAELGMTTPNMAAALRALEETGMVRRRPDMSDGRKVFVDVTKRGQLVVDRTSLSRHAWFQEAVDEALDLKERQLLFQAGELIQRIAEFDPYAPGKRARPKAKLSMSNLYEADGRTAKSSSHRGTGVQKGRKVVAGQTERARKQ